MSEAEWKKASAPPRPASAEPEMKPEPDTGTIEEAEAERVSLARRAGRMLGAAANGFLSWLLTNLTSALAFLVYRVFNRVRVYGRKRVGHERNTLILPNHRTMIDSYLVGHLTSWPWGWVKPHVLPYHPAAQENFFRNRFIGWLSARWRCIPVKRGVRDFNALSSMIETLPKGQMVLFPEGTRSRTGELLRGRPGSGKLIKDTRCKCVPCYVDGMEKVLPIGCSFPKLFKKVDVIFGKPIDFGDLLDLPDCKESSQKVIDRVMEEIAGLEQELAAIRRARAERRQTFARGFQRVVMFPAQMVRRLFASVR
jgi:1-acyl-sn-glycerol-3-phosphate acyltransferase